jgi:hypothetical protein
MKIKVRVWWIAWDTDEGTGCDLFATERKWFARFREIILKDIGGIDNFGATAIRQHLDASDFDSAYTLWQNDYKSEMDTYNWGEEEMEYDTNGEEIAVLREEALKQLSCSRA